MKTRFVDPLNIRAEDKVVILSLVLLSTLHLKQLKRG
jgi:hypothetical protein